MPLAVPSLLDPRDTWPPDAETLASNVLAAPALEDALANELGDALDAPAEELTATGASTRVAIAAANEGRRFVHHELRMPPLLHAELLPELEVDLEPERWRDGILRAPKYFSAFLEAPRPTFDPNHRAKWRPHELLHRLARFAWRPTMTRFEAYLTARVSELLPVVHWYGFDEIGRLRCPAHYLQRPTAHYCPACDRLSRRPIGAQTEDPLFGRHARNAASHALDHLADELAACRRELATGQICATPRVGLDASSDAVGYMRAHWNRLTAWSFGAWIERFCIEGDDFFAGCGDHLEHVDALARRLITEPRELDAPVKRDATTRLRSLQDLGYRALLCIEALDSDEAEAALLPLVDRLAEHAVECREGHAAASNETLEELGHALASLDPAASPSVFGVGDIGTRREPATSVVVDRICGGLRSALPRSLGEIADDELREWAQPFIENAFGGRGEVFVRFAAFVEAVAADKQPAWTDAVILEAWLRAAPTLDLDAERFAVVPDGPPDRSGRLRANATIRRASFTRSAVQTVLDLDEETTNVELVAAYFAGSPRAVPCTANVANALECAENGEFGPDWEDTDALLAAGLLVWLPDPA